MAKYYPCGMMMANIQAALLDYYGAYDASTNPNGVTIYASSTTLLIFSCPAISDKVVKFTGISTMRAYYGDAYDSGTTDITNAVEWGGSTTAGSTSAIHLCLAESTLLCVILVSSINSRVWMIGQLTNGKYVVQGLIGLNSSIYRAGAYGKRTDGAVDLMVHGLASNYSVGGKLAKSPLVFVSIAGAEMNGTEIAALNDVYSVSRRLGASVAYKGSDYFISPSDLYNNDGDVLYSSIIMEGLTN